jgi:hypothetical protein
MDAVVDLAIFGSLTPLQQRKSFCESNNEIQCQGAASLFQLPPPAGTVRATSGGCA